MEVWLKDDCSDAVYFPVPETDGQFNLENVPSYTTFIVEGPTINGFHPKTLLNFGVRGQSITSVRHAGSLPGLPIFRSVVSHKKIILKKISKKRKSVEFEFISQMYIGMTDSTANITFVIEEVQRQWGEEYVIVSNEAATQGMYIATFHSYN